MPAARSPQHSLHLPHQQGLVALLCLIILMVVACNEAPGEKEPTPPPPFDKTASLAKIKLLDSAYNVGFLIMDGVYNTELTAPYDIFHHTVFREGIRPMNVFTIADKHEAVVTFEGLQLLPDFNYLMDSLPRIDILVVPSAEHHLDTDLENREMLDFVRTTSAESAFVTSHCDGAFVLAEAGLLDSIESTTFPSDIAAFRQRYPGQTVHEDVLFVHDGKFITSAGGAKSFEASLYLCELLYGKKVADRLAEGLVIDWDLPSVPHKVIVR